MAQLDIAGTLSLRWTNHKKQKLDFSSPVALVYGLRTGKHHFKSPK